MTVIAIWFARDGSENGTYAIGVGDKELAVGLDRETAALLAQAPNMAKALCEIGAQSVGPDWSAVDAMLWVRARARECTRRLKRDGAGWLTQRPPAAGPAP